MLELAHKLYSYLSGQSNNPETKVLNQCIDLIRKSDMSDWARSGFEKQFNPSSTKANNFSVFAILGGDLVNISRREVISEYGRAASSVFRDITAGSFHFDNWRAERVGMEFEKRLDAHYRMKSEVLEQQTKDLPVLIGSNYFDIIGRIEKPRADKSISLYLEKGNSQFVISLTEGRKAFNITEGRITVEGTFEDGLVNITSQREFDFKKSKFNVEALSKLYQGSPPAYVRTRNIPSVVQEGMVALEFQGERFIVGTGRPHDRPGAFVFWFKSRLLVDLKEEAIMNGIVTLRAIPESKKAESKSLRMTQSQDKEKKLSEQLVNLGLATTGKYRY